MCELTRRERKKEVTRTNIMCTAIKLFQESSFESTTMHQISAEADVAMGTLYNYFPSKESIIGAYVNWVSDQYRERYWDKLMDMDNTYDRLQFVLQIVAEWHTQNKDLSEIYVSNIRQYMYGSNWEGIPKNVLEEGIIELLKMGQQLGDIKAELDPVTLVGQLLGMVYTATLEWLADKSRTSGGPIYKQALDIFFQGCRPEQANSAEFMYYLFF